MKKKSENSNNVSDRVIKGIRQQTRKHYSAEDLVERLTKRQGVQWTA